MQAKMTSGIYYNAKDIVALTGCPRTRAYEVIAQLNAELEEKGFITFKGRTPRRYAEERLNITREVQDNATTLLHGCPDGIQAIQWEPAPDAEDDGR